MKAIEILARDYSLGEMAQCQEYTEYTIERAYEAGFRKARDMLIEKFGYFNDGCDCCREYDLVDVASDLGEEVAQ